MNEPGTFNYKEEYQKIASSTFGPMLLNPALTAMLRAQSSMLASMGSVMTAWIRHRREALAEAELMIARIQSCRNPAEIWGMQQEWIGHAMQRLSDDAAQWQKAVMSLAEAASNGQAALRE